MRLVHFKPRHKKSHKRHGRSMSKYRRNPGRRRHYRHNPAALKAILNPQSAMGIGGVAVGFIGGAKLGKMIFGSSLFTTGPLKGVRRFAGLVTFALGAFAASKVKGDAVKKVAMGVAASGVYDIFAQNIPQIGITPISGESIDVRGAGYDLVGDDPMQNDEDMEGESINVNGDMTELVGDDMEGDSIYA